MQHSSNWNVFAIMIICAMRYRPLNCTYTADSNLLFPYWSGKQTASQNLSSVVQVMFSTRHSMCLHKEGNYCRHFTRVSGVTTAFWGLLTMYSICFLHFFCEAVKHKHTICLLLPKTACQDRVGCIYMGEINSDLIQFPLIPFPMTFHYRPTQKNTYCPWLMQRGVTQAPKKGGATYSAKILSSFMVFHNQTQKYPPGQSCQLIYLEAKRALKSIKLRWMHAEATAATWNHQLKIG